jgi:hypothetical protein
VVERKAVTDEDVRFVGVASGSSLSTDRREAVGVRSDGVRGAAAPTPLFTEELFEANREDASLGWRFTEREVDGNGAC